MGGHGGLNILPQKRWNVYGRENRLKVARDEEKYEAEQKVIRDKHEAAEREHRHNLLLERARERHGGRANVLVTTDGHTELPSNLEDTNTTQQQQQQTIEREEDGAAIDKHTRLTITGRVGTSNDAMAALEAIEEEEEEDDLQLSVVSAVPARKRHKPHHHQQQPPSDNNHEWRYPTTTINTTKSEAGKAPSLADLAKTLQHHHQDVADEGLQKTNNHNKTDTEPASWVVNARQKQQQEAQQQPLQHINLFAEEESRAKNPEKEAETRRERKKRGNTDTQTSDAKFDAQFQFAHGLSGKSNVPWYAQRHSSLETYRDGDDGGECLTTEQQYHQTGQLRIGGSSGKTRSIKKVSQLKVWQEQGNAALTASAGIDKQLAHTAKVDSASAHTSSDTSTDPNVKERDEKPKKSNDKKHKKHKHKSKDRKREEKESKTAHKEREKAEMLLKLREERLKREYEERQRQKQIVSNSRGGGGRYNASYGFGR